MNKKTTIIIGIFMVAITLGVIGFFGATSQARGANSPSDWSGTWQMGPNLDTTMLGCTAGNGLARYTGIYYPELDRVYFLGGRCEDNTTKGLVFYFDPVTQTYASTGVTLTTPVSNYQVVRIDDDLQGHGPGLYIVGGRNDAGGQTNAVQVYYPNDNTTALIDTDPFPPAVLYSPGGVVANNGSIYVFGGFDGVNMYASTYIYDSAAAAGSRWTLTACDLPTARSYIGSLVVNDLIYAIGGDEYISSLTPIDDTVVFDPANPGTCWQDGLMADLPQANGDAPAVYVDENYIGGGIFVVGGFWPSPGPNRWVFRYDVTTDLWETFPDLAIPAPATGRRNQAAVYIPSTSAGTGDGIPGLWTFGGYDGSGTNAMTESAEFFANPVTDLLLLPDHMAWVGVPGLPVTDNFAVVNESAIEDSYDLSFTSDVTWTVSLPPTIGPIPPGSQDTFAMTVDIPASVDCGVISSFTVTVTSQANPATTASATITVRAICAVTGTITDANTGLGIANAYVWAQNSVDGLDVYKDGYTDADGNYLLADVAPDFYYFGASALHYQPSFYPQGWPEGAITFTVGAEPVFIDAELLGSEISLDATSISVRVLPSSTVTRTLTLANSGLGPYYGSFTLMNNAKSEQAQAEALPVPGLARIDDQILTDINASPDKTTDFVAVLSSQADTSSAYNIADWSERGQVVYDILTRHAETSQAGLRSFLDSQHVAYTPLYIINAVIIHAGNADLVNSLAARQDIAQLVANHRIAVEDQPVSYIETLLQPVTVPGAIEWNIARIKADQVWTDFGVTGEGAVVAEIDTGTQYDHPALVNQYRGNLGGGTFDHNYNWYDPYFQCPDSGKTPCDPGAHGTHVMGTMVGDDGGANQIGVAPGAKWISCKGGDAVSGYLLTDELLVCAQWILAPTDLNGLNPDPAMRPNVVNNSWGGGKDDYWYGGAISAWRAAGIFPAFSAGNNGPACSTTGSPGDNWNSFASGASDNANNIAGFSSRGPSYLWDFLKPQITAPGVSVRSSVPTNGYALYNGTSMASPHSAGAVALLLSAAPELVGQVDLTEWVLEQTATPFYTTEGCGGDLPDTHPNNTFGYGLLDIHAAVTLAKEGNLIPSWVSIDPMSANVGPGGSMEINLTFTAPAEEGTLTTMLLIIGNDPYHPEINIPITMNVGQLRIMLPLIRR